MNNYCIYLIPYSYFITLSSYMDTIHHHDATSASYDPIEMTPVSMGTYENLR